MLVCTFFLNFDCLAVFVVNVKAQANMKQHGKRLVLLELAIFRCLCVTRKVLFYLNFDGLAVCGFEFG